MTGTITKTPCPQCQEFGGLHIIIELVAKPVGSWSLAGAQTKYSAQKLPLLKCDHCTLKQVGRFDGGYHAVFDSPSEAPSDLPTPDSTNAPKASRPGL